MSALLRVSLAPVFLLALAGCFVSDAPLFNAGNASAIPLGAGDYDVCSGSTDDEAVECNPMTVSVTADGLYSFAVEDDRMLARFLPIDEDDYAVQIDDGDGEEYQYYWGRKADDSVTLVMIWCEDLPRSLVDKLIEDGGVEADERYQTCTAKSASAVVVAAKAYIGGEVADQNWVKLTPSATPQ